MQNVCQIRIDLNHEGKSGYDGTLEIADYEIEKEATELMKRQAKKLLAGWLVNHWIKKHKNHSTFKKPNGINWLNGK